jgi:hypothetical protein
MLVCRNSVLLSMSGRGVLVAGNNTELHRHIVAHSVIKFPSFLVHNLQHVSAATVRFSCPSLKVCAWLCGNSGQNLDEKHGYLTVVLRWMNDHRHTCQYAIFGIQYPGHSCASSHSAKVLHDISGG